MRAFYSLVFSLLLLAGCSSNNGNPQMTETENSGGEAIQEAEARSVEYPILRTWEYAKHYADSLGLAYEVKTGTFDFVTLDEEHSIAMVGFKELVEDDDSTNYTGLRMLDPVLYAIDLKKTCFLICDEKLTSFTLGDVQVDWNSAQSHFKSVRIYVTKDENRKSQLILVVQEDVAG